jgi:hypothetical protein
VIVVHKDYGDVEYRAGFGEGGTESIYRFTLSRLWYARSPGLFTKWDGEPGVSEVALFIMLNPSVADAKIDDPTVAKCMRLARAWGFGGVEVRNLFAYRATNPAGLKAAVKEGIDPIGGAINDAAIMSAVTSRDTGVIVAAWGNHGSLLRRSHLVREMLEQAKRPVYSFKISALKEPEHPLYQREDVTPDDGMVRYL